MELYVFWALHRVFLGISLALFLRHFESNKSFLRSTATFIGLFLTSVCLYMLILLNEGSSERSTISYASIIVNNVFLAISVSLLLWGLVKEKNLITKALSSSLMQLLGKSSYVFYLIHVSFVGAIINRWITDCYIFQFIALIIISIGLFKFIEEPLNNYIRRKIAVH